MTDKNRIYVFRDNFSGMEKECSEQTAITMMNLRQYINGQQRFVFLRSFIPVVTSTKKISRTSHDNGETRKQSWSKIKGVKETEVSTNPPRIVRTRSTHGLMTKLETTWLEPMSASELPEAPDKIKRGRR